MHPWKVQIFTTFYPKRFWSPRKVTQMFYCRLLYPRSLCFPFFFFFLIDRRQNVAHQPAKLLVAFPYQFIVLVLLCQCRVGARLEDASGAAKDVVGSWGEPGCTWQGGLWEGVWQEVSWRKATARNRIRIMREILQRAEQRVQSFSWLSGCPLAWSGKGKLPSPAQRGWCCFSWPLPVCLWNIEMPPLCCKRVFCFLTEQKHGLLWPYSAMWHPELACGAWAWCTGGLNTCFQFSCWGGRFVSASSGIHVCVLWFVASHLD